MHKLSPAPLDDQDTEYRAIEATLLESARGRWFLAEHGRRARRLDSALLEDAITRLQTSLRQPPALLGQLETEVETLKGQLIEARQTVVARPGQDTESGAIQPHAILKAAEDIHELAWSLQANPFDPKGCETIARNAGRIYALTQTHAKESERVLAFASSLDSAVLRLEAILETVAHENKVDAPEAAA